MKRDIDLARQLLLDVEARGADCSVSVLRTDPNDAEERVRHHLRLLVDAGYLKEVDRTAGGVPCLRLTDAGHELIELTRSESRWRQAKWACQERTGGLSVAVVRAILLEWATAVPPQWRRRRRVSVPTSFFVERPYAEQAPFELDAVEDAWDYPAADADEQVRYVRVRPKYRGGWRRRDAGLNGKLPERDFESVLPETII